MGSLVAAVASYLRARQANGEWLLRIEDIDPPREVQGAAAGFLTTLELFGFEWDGEVVYQHQRTRLYQDALAQLVRDGFAYRCVCSRRQLKMAVEAGTALEGVYPGTCLHAPPADDIDTNWRFVTRLSRSGQQTPEQTDSASPTQALNRVLFHDQLQGEQETRFGQSQGDFVIWRKDDLPSYQLAVSVDDLDQGITEVVRGIDLLQETAGQMLLHQALRQNQNKTPIKWMHIPVVVDQRGDKLSKQTHAAAVDAQNAAQHLCDALTLLGLETEASLRRAALQEIWTYAIEHWTPKHLYLQDKATLD